MKKLMLLAAVLAMAMVAAAPAVAQVGQGTEQDIESGDATQNITISGGDSGNSNQCSPVQGVGQTGNSVNSTSVLQANGDDNEVEVDDSGNATVSPEQNPNVPKVCEQRVNQAASAAAAPKAAPALAPSPAPAPAPAPKASPATAPEVPPAPASEVKAATAEAKAAPAPEAEAPKAAPGKGELPQSGGAGAGSLFALGAGALLVAGGLVARRITN